MGDHGVDLVRPSYTVRTNDEEMQASLESSAVPEWVATLPLVDQDDLRVTVDASSLLVNRFFIAKKEAKLPNEMRVKQAKGA